MAAAAPPCTYSFRRARADDLPALTSIHANNLEVPYEESFLKSLAHAGDGDALLCLVAEPAVVGAAVGSKLPLCAVLSARVEWSLRGAAAAAAAAIAAVVNGDSSNDAVEGAVSARTAAAPQGGHPGYVLTLAVDPPHRGRGLARALLEAACASLAARCGVDEISLHCLAANVAGRALYNSAGFTVQSTLPGFYYFPGDSRAHDAVLYSRSLGTPADAHRRAEAALARVRSCRPSAAAGGSAATMLHPRIISHDGSAGEDVIIDAEAALPPAVEVEASMPQGTSDGADDSTSTVSAVASKDLFAPASTAAARDGFVALIYTALRTIVWF